MALEIRPGYDDKEVVRMIFEEYTNALIAQDKQMEQYLSMQNFDEELLHLEKKYGEPHGRLYLAWDEGEICGSVALKPMDEEGYCEMKRLYVRPQFRGKKISLLLSEKIIDEARKAGYTYMRLDTLPFLTRAIALYKKLGFYEITPYNENPIAGSVYLEYKL